MHKALYVQNPNSLAIQQISLKKLEADEVLVRPLFCGICGSDLKLFKGDYHMSHRYPLIPGHEWVGRVVDKGANVAQFDIGDRVTGECSHYCGECVYCREIDKNLCVNIVKYGISRDGFFATAAVVHKRHLHSLSDVELPDLLCCLIEPTAVVIHGFERLLKAQFRKVLVLGAGPIGLLACLYLKKQIANTHVTIVDTNSKRLEIAEKFSADKTINCPLDRLSQKMGSDKFELIVESSGYKGVVEIIRQLVEEKGQVLLFTQNPEVSIPTDLIVGRMISFYGNVGGAGSFDAAIRLLERQKMTAAHLIDNIFELDHLPHVVDKEFGLLSQGGKSIVRISAV
ncbi:MAG: alcohol dehydrogenase catalytic domain-containing protein [Nitrospirota bacterium]|nr:alcohol dehydrogenase catalytic domain-containing protein [Nitrospirota bacterium]